MQRTFGDIVGMEPVVPTAPHKDDIVTCSDDTECPLLDTFTDCRDGVHSNEEDRDAADLAIVTEVLDDIVKWADEYTQNDDYADGYFCILDEGNVSYEDDLIGMVDDADWVDVIEDAFNNNELDRSEFDNFMEKCEGDDTVDHDWGLTDYIKDRFYALSNDYVASAISTNLDYGFDCEPEHSGNEFGRYSGSGLCVGGFDIGEHEEQVDITCHDELLELHNEGRLNDCLKAYNGEGYVSLSRSRVKNEKTGRYEYVGEETYDPYGRGSTTFEMYTSPGGRWDFVVPAERIEELRCEAIVAYAEKALEEHTPETYQ